MIERFAHGPGGAELDAVLVTDKLLERGHDVTVVCGRSGLSERAGLSILDLGVSRLWQPLRVTLFSRRACAATASGFDVVYSLSRTRHQDVYRIGGGTHASYMERVYARPGLQRALNPRHRAILRLEEAALRDPRQHIHCIARAGADDVARRYGVEEARLHIIYNGVDSERFHPRNRERLREERREELGLSGPAALFVGGGVRRKGLDRAISGLARSSTDASLIVVGGGDKASARSLARELGVEKRVFFLGHREDVPAWHAAADLLVLPTRYDPFGNAVLEAMASGLAVATTSEAGAAELIEHGRNGFVLDEDFEPAFDRLADLPALARIGRAARETAETHDWNAHIDALLALFERARA